MSELELAVAVSIEGEECSLPPMIGVSAYRIVQEALTNTLKHAAASRADVRVRYLPTSSRSRSSTTAAARRRYQGRARAAWG